jgi:hypothetical protein
MYKSTVSGEEESRVSFNVQITVPGKLLQQPDADLFICKKPPELLSGGLT